MASTTQIETLNSLFADYTNKKKLYDIEVIDNYRAYNDSSSGFDPVASDASLIAKKKNMDDALAAYNLYKQDIADQASTEFAAANPTLAVEMEKNAAEIKAKAEIESQALVLAAKHKQTILFVGIGVLVVVILGFVYLKFVKKKLPE